MITIGVGVSRVRNLLKAVKEDSFITDRFIYSVITKYAKMYIKREDDKNRIMRMSTLFSKIPCVELIETDAVEACCIGISTGCIIKRTKDRIPNLMDGSFGPIIRTVASLDLSENVYITDPVTYLSITNSSNFKYNKTKYFWHLDGYLFFPNLDWEGVMIDGIFEDSVAGFACNSEDTCLVKQDQNLIIPDYLFAEIEQAVLNDMRGTLNIPQDPADDKQNSQR